MKRSTWILCSLGACLLSACSDDDDEIYRDDDVVVDDALADAAADAATLDQSQVAMTYAMTDPLYDEFYYYDDAFLYERLAATTEPPMSPEALATRIVSNVSAYFVPEGCVSASQSGAAATVVFDRCDTTLGAADISGTVTVQFSRVQGGYAMNIATAGLVIDGGVLDLDLDATGSRSGEQRTLSGTSAATWRGPNGTIERELDLTLSWTQGSGCVVAEGDGASDLDELTFRGKLTGYRQCAGQCPAAGTLVWSAADSQMTLSFDGTSSPSLVSSDGTSRELDLTCEES